MAFRINLGGIFKFISGGALARQTDKETRGLAAAATVGAVEADNKAAQVYTDNKVRDFVQLEQDEDERIAAELQAEADAQGRQLEGALPTSAEQLEKAANWTPTS